MVQIDHVLDEIENLSLEDQEMILEMLQKRIIEQKRDEIVSLCKAGVTAYKQGQSRSGSVEKLFKEIEDD
jgi:transcriptional regulator with AAA-type ATPase domain